MVGYENRAISWENSIEISRTGLAWMDQKVDVGIGLPYKSLPKEAIEIIPTPNWKFNEVYTIHSPHGLYEAKLDATASNVYYPVWEQLDSEIGIKFEKKNW